MSAYEATLFTWFMLTQSGFGTRIAYNKQNIYLFVKATSNVLRTTYFTINGSKYHGINFSKNHADLPYNFYTCEGNYPKSEEKEIDLHFVKLPVILSQQEE